MTQRISLITFLLLVSFIISCDENNNFVIFSVNDDIELGKQVRDEIAADPAYKILPSSQYPQLYNFLYNMRDAILNSGEIAYKEEFAWELYVIDDDNVQNAFAVPGGYIYVYTGLIKYLDHADDLAGVLAHEIAHADERHTVRNLQKMYGVSILLSVALGEDPSQLTQIAGQIAGTLAGLRFSREFEEEADAHSVEYLAHTKYACNAAGLFFSKMIQDGNSAAPPEFLSTHPNPDNRVESINEHAQEIGCDTSLSNDSNYNTIKNNLP